MLTDLEPKPIHQLCWCDCGCQASINKPTFAVDNLCLLCKGGAHGWKDDS